MVIGLAKMRESNLLTETFSLFVVDNDKLLVSGGVDQELKTFSFEEILHPHGHSDGMLRELEIKLISEQGLELQTDECSFGYDGTVLLLNGEEVLVGFAVGKDHGLTAKGPNLRTADIEHVAVTGQIGQGDVVAGGHQTVSQTGTIDIKGYLIVLTYLIDVVEFLSAVKRAELRGEGDIDQSRMHSVIFIAVVHIVVEVFVEHLGLQFPICVREGDDLVLREFHGASLVHVDMTAADTDNTLILIEHRIDGSGIGLRTSRQEKDLRIRQTTGLADTSLGTFRELVEAIWCRPRIVILHEVVDHLLTGSVVIITLE